MRVHPSCVNGIIVKPDMIIFGKGLSEWNLKKRTQNVAGDQGGNEWEDGLQTGQNLHSYIP